MRSALEQRQDLRGETAGARTNFQNAQTAPFRERARGAANRGRDRGEPVTGEETVAVKVIEQFRADAREQDLNRVLLAPQNRA